MIPNPAAPDIDLQSGLEKLYELDPLGSAWQRPTGSRMAHLNKGRCKRTA
jgi:hypothetical protein